MALEIAFASFPVTQKQIEGTSTTPDEVFTRQNCESIWLSISWRSSPCCMWYSGPVRLTIAWTITAPLDPADVSAPFLTFPRRVRIGTTLSLLSARTTHLCHRLRMVSSCSWLNWALGKELFRKYFYHLVLTILVVLLTHYRWTVKFLNAQVLQLAYFRPMQRLDCLIAAEIVFHGRPVIRYLSWPKIAAAYVPTVDRSYNNHLEVFSNMNADMLVMP